MYEYLPIPDNAIEQAVQQIKERHQKCFGTFPESLVFAFAYKRLANEILEKHAKQQVEIAGLPFDVES